MNKRIHGVPLPTSGRQVQRERESLDEFMTRYPEVDWVEVRMIRRTFTDGGWGDPHPRVTHIRLTYGPDPHGDGGVVPPTGLRQEDLDAIAAAVVDRSADRGGTWEWRPEGEQ